MGKELRCECRFSGRRSVGKAKLETDDIQFRGDFKLVVPFREITSVEAVDDKLRIVSTQGDFVLAIGPTAKKWAEFILHPPTLLDKLGIKPGLAVSIIDMNDPAFVKELSVAKLALSEGAARQESDIILLGIETRAQLAKLKSVSKRIKSTGAVWAIYPKGTTTVTQSDVRAAALACGLVDVKVCRFSQQRTALKFVIPVSRRL